MTETPTAEQIAGDIEAAQHDLLLWARHQRDADYATATAEHLIALLRRAREEATDAELRRIDRRITLMSGVTTEALESLIQSVLRITGW